MYDLHKFPTLAAKVIEDRSLEGVFSSVRGRVSRQIHVLDERRCCVSDHKLPLVVPLKAVLALKEDSVLPLSGRTWTRIGADQENDR